MIPNQNFFYIFIFVFLIFSSSSSWPHLSCRVYSREDQKIIRELKKKELKITEIYINTFDKKEYEYLEN